MGGPTIHLPYLVNFFQKKEPYQIRTFEYGSKIDGGSLIDGKETLLSKFINNLQVFVLFFYDVIVFRPHIIHINTAFDKRALIRDIPFSVFSFVFRKKLIFKIHGSSYELIDTRNKLYLLLIKLFFLGAKKVGVLSEIEKKEFISRFGYTKRIVVTKNIVLPEKIGAKEGVHFFEKDPAKTYGLFVSRIVKGKGLIDVIRALPSILKFHAGFILVVAGDGPEKESCIKVAIELNVNNSIIWLGFVNNDQLSQLFIRSDIYCFLSHLPEGMPMSLVEALRHGMPIITTKVRFALDHLEEHINCLFVDPGNVNDITDKINTLIVNKELQKEMRKVNPEIVEKFSPEIVGNEFEVIYKQMLDKSGQ